MIKSSQSLDFINGLPLDYEVPSLAVEQSENASRDGIAEGLVFFSRGKEITKV